MRSSYHGQIVESKFVREQRPCQQIGYLQGQRSSIFVFLFDNVSHFVVNADGKASIDVVLLYEPVHANKHDVQIVNSWALHHPVDPWSHEL